MAAVKKVFKYILMLNLCLALVSLLGSAWLVRTVGSQAYAAGAVATVVVGIAASLALLISSIHSRQVKADSGVSGVLLAMLVRMGLPLAVLLGMQQLHSPLLEAGFTGLLVLNYLVALPLETLMSLAFQRETTQHESGSDVSATAISS